MDKSRTRTVRVAGREYPMNFSMRAMQRVSERYNSIDNMTEALLDKDRGKADPELIWMLHLLIWQGVERQNILEGTSGGAPTEETLWTLVDMADTVRMIGAVMDTVAAGLERKVETEKNGETTQSKTVP